MKKIIYSISSLKHNGPNRVLLSMIDGIDKNKYEVYIVSFLDNNDLNYVEEIKKKVAKVFLIKVKRKIDIISKGKKEFQKIIDEINPDIIHSHGILPDIANAKIKSKAKKITTIHNNMFEDYIYSFGKLKGSIFIKWHLHYLKKFNKCVCCSSSAYDILKKHLKNTTYVRNAIFRKAINKKEYNEKRVKIRETHGIKNDDIVYIYVGVLTKRKRVEEMVDKFNSTLASNEYLLILGNGEINLESHIKNKHIITVGFVKNVIEYMCASDIYVSFSSSEGFSISILEALETYNLLLLSDIPSHKEIYTISRKIYLGEFFNLSNFIDCKNRIERNIFSLQKTDYNNFLLNNLSIKKMMDSYSIIYND